MKGIYMKRTVGRASGGIRVACWSSGVAAANDSAARLGGPGPIALTIQSSRRAGVASGAGHGVSRAISGRAAADSIARAGDRGTAVANGAT